MEGHERAGATPEKRGVPIDSPMAQGALMLFEYREAHRGEPQPPTVDLVNLEQNDLGVEAAAREEWVEGDPSFAALYRNLIEKNPLTIVDIYDEEVLASLLAQLAEEKRARILH